MPKKKVVIKKESKTTKKVVKKVVKQTPKKSVVPKVEEREVITAKAPVPTKKTIMEELAMKMSEKPVYFNKLRVVSVYMEGKQRPGAYSCKLEDGSVEFVPKEFFD